ncbi:hypothetical protein FHU38_004371 [Saccharomonospora amisosensis]|uniref:DUF4237 domain-containing protein n=1 Tax=Saccharomonospora amisosensis TaxID=1128677 RepID=A0A7X5UTN1_9PSEU|nr:TNT domain-containing protein [Saccharomonospora amisosensis]NIJ14027.1 hypothetical protein [Saccharomonospora amisosensis]
MGVELPAELAGIAAETGTAWPQADEDAMREQAAAWRRAAHDLTTLAGEADSAAGNALDAMSGPAEEAARHRWSGIVSAGNGSMMEAAAGANQAADRLEHAAEQVGKAKVEIVRQLVTAARNRDAALAAAQAGHPGALAALDTTLRGTAANLGAVTTGLADAVGPSGSAPLDTATELVAPNPGAHTSGGQSGLLAATTGLPAEVVEEALGAPDGRGPSGTVEVEVEEPLAAGEPHDSAQSLDLAEPVAFAESVEPWQPPSPESEPDPLPHVWRGREALDGPAPVLAAGPEDTGPIAITHARTPPSGQPAASLGFADAPTPPSGTALAPPPAGQSHGQTHLAGFTGGPVAAQPVAGPPVAGPPVAGQFAPQPPVPAAQPFAAPPYAGQQFGPGAVPYGPVAGGPPVPGAPATAAPTAGPGHAPRAAPPQSFRWGPEQHHQQRAPHPPQAPDPARPQQPAAHPPVGAARQDRQSVVALFLVHMFPIGHLPVATDKPARQLPVPAGDCDYAAGLRFPPHDHPESGTIDPTVALASLRAGVRQPAPPPAEVLPCPPATLSEGHDPLGGMDEREWDRRYVVHAGQRAEFAWPPGERYPEGGCEPGEPVLLAPDTVLDRFGTALGRVFAEDGTPFARRSLPPALLEAGYRRYRVLRELPMWRALSAPWFGQPGGGVRYRSVYSAAELVTLGYLADVTFEERP